MESTAVIACAGCGSELADGLLACPSCHRLVHTEKLKELATQGTAAESANDPTEAARLWRLALELLPPTSKQYQSIAAKVSGLTSQIDAGAKPSPTRAASGNNQRVGKRLGVAGLAVVIASKAKLLLMGLTNLPTLLSMLAYMGVYWSRWGWQFAAGMVLSIYVHEMGHVVALRRYGFKATAPMFIPGLGALIRLQQNPVDAREDARIGLAGPTWGLGAAIASAILWYVTGQPVLGAIARVGAWVNLFNLTPFWTLDGGRGFRALSRIQAWCVTGAAAAGWYYWREGMFALVAILAVIQSLKKRGDESGDERAFIEFLGLMITLGMLSQLHVPVH